MPPRLTNQTKRLSYTRRDLTQIDEEIELYIKSFIPTIKNTGQANTGRMLLRLLAGLLDKQNYAIDMTYRQSILRTVDELQAAIDIAELVRYKPNGASTASTDLVVSTLGGPAGVGGIPIAQYQVFATTTNPVKQFIATQATAIPEGSSGGQTISVIQGVRVVDQTILDAAVGEPNERIAMPVARTPHDYLEIKVDGEVYSQVDDFRDSVRTDKHYMLTVNSDRVSILTFGDGEYGALLPAGATVTATYIQSLGEAGNCPPGKITKVVGSLSSQIAVTNPEAATGGSDGDRVEDIVRKAPRQASTFARASHERDFEALAESLVDGVYRALSSPGDGALLDLYIMPNGGGVASSALLTRVEETLATRVALGTTVNAKALISAHIYIKMKVLLLSSSTNKSVAKRKLYEALSAFRADGAVNEDGALYYRNLNIGRGFALSDVSNIIENIDEGNLVDYVDYVAFTRYPSPVAATANPSVEFVGEIVPNESCGYAAWSVQYRTPTTFSIYKNGVKSGEGTIGVPYTTSDGWLTFTLGRPGETIDANDRWSFKSSAYRNNMRLDKFEFMELARDSDLDITIYYPGELSVGT